MKSTIKLLITLTLFLSTWNAGSAQIIIVNTNEVLKADSIDNAIFSVQYEMSFVTDTLNPEKTANETMMLKVGRQSSVFYSYSKYLTDSIVERYKASGAGLDAISEALNKYRSRITWKVYKNYPTGKVTWLDQLAMNRFRCEENNEAQQWQIHPDTTTILSYPCQRATCYFRGRVWEAWFAMDIPRSEGPWKLHGLPGLILKAQDSRGHYTFECTGITQHHGRDPITIATTNHEPVSRKNLNKLYERYAADPVGYSTATNPNVKITIKNESGETIRAPKNTPFNPIEHD